VALELELQFRGVPFDLWQLGDFVADAWPSLHSALRAHSIPASVAVPVLAILETGQGERPDRHRAGRAAGRSRDRTQAEVDREGQGGNDSTQRLRRES
jgi:hypothetical protein